MLRILLRLTPRKGCKAGEKALHYKFVIRHIARCPKPIDGNTLCVLG